MGTNFNRLVSLIFIHGHILDQQQKMLDLMFQKTIFIGYRSTSKADRLWNLRRKEATYEDFIKQDEKRSSDFEFLSIGNLTVVISKHSLSKEDSDIITPPSLPKVSKY